MTRKIYLIAGEPSGDLHGAHLVEALKRLDDHFVFRGFGGPKMEQAGVELDQTIDQLSFMGFAEVVKHFPRIFSNFRLAKSAIRSWKPHAIVYIDFPGFNMRMAKWSRKHGYKNFYYIVPQVWAWKAKRALKLKRDIDQMFSILPFEPTFFDRYGCEVNYVGHPLVDIIRKYRASHSEEENIAIQTRVLSRETAGKPEDSNSKTEGKKVIALLPGSRKQEVDKIFPAQIQAVREMLDFDVVVGKSPHVPRSVYDKIIEESGQVKVPISFEEGTYSLLSRAHMACVASGTATLETALFKVPQAVCFRGSTVTYKIARRLVKVPFISLVNLVMNTEVVRELIQDELNPTNLRKELEQMMDPMYRDRMKHQYNMLEQKLGVGGAAEKTAKIILQNMGK